MVGQDWERPAGGSDEELLPRGENWAMTDRRPLSTGPVRAEASAQEAFAVPPAPRAQLAGVDQRPAQLFRPSRAASRGKGHGGLQQHPGVSADLAAVPAAEQVRG